jgi:hypothetical protein
MIGQMNLTDIYRISQPLTEKYTFFPVAHGTFSITDHILGHKSSLNISMKITITPKILSENNRLKLKISIKRNYRKCSTT